MGVKWGARSQERSWEREQEGETTTSKTLTSDEHPNQRHQHDIHYPDGYLPNHSPPYHSHSHDYIPLETRVIAPESGPKKFDGFEISRIWHSSGYLVRS